MLAPESLDPAVPACCLPMLSPARRAALLPMPGLDDEEGPRLPSSLPEVVDAHVHLFPDAVFEALWRWFDTHAWPIRYKLRTPEVIDFLFSRGVSRVVALHYAHRPGMARGLNRYIAQLAHDEPRIIGLGTVLPGEPGAVEVVREAFALGLSGLKLHCHVQRLSPDAPELHQVYEAAVAADRPVVIHAGREPASPAYPVDPYTLCAVERVERVLQDHPTLKLCVPHLGADEFEGYERLLERYENLWLDTTMMVADYFPLQVPRRLLSVRPERVLYGTDFPNLPYAWDREVRALAAAGLSEPVLAGLLGGNALRLFGR